MEGANRVAGQLRGDKECPFSGVTKSGRVWRKVPESDARRVLLHEHHHRSVRSPTCGSAIDLVMVYITVPTVFGRVIREAHRDHGI